MANNRRYGTFEYGDVYNIEEIRLARIVYRVQQMK